MRIISKFKDYYDSAAAFGFDKDVVYLRKTQEIEPQQSRSGNRPTLLIDRTTNTKYEYRRGNIGFCGKLYPFVEIVYYDNHTQLSIRFWSFASLSTWLDKIYPYWAHGYRMRRRWRGKYKGWMYGVFMEHFKESQDIEMFHTHQVPVFCKWHDGLLILNPKLADFEFYRHFGPYQAHQEIAMFVGGVLNQTENRMIELSNDVRIAKHGYDEYSFRAQKGEGPKRKRKK